MKGAEKKSAHYSSDEEVLAFDGEEEDDDDDENYAYEDKYEGKSDNEDEDDQDNEDEYDVPNSWGRKKSAYYSGNKLQNDEDALLEEEEANKMQVKMMKQLDNNDFGLDEFKINNKVLKTNEDLATNKMQASVLEHKIDEDNFEKILKNLTKMTKKEKLDFLQQESPELFELIRDFKSKVN